LKVAFILIALVISLSLSADPLKKEREMIKTDKIFISKLEKELSVDEKGCDKPSSDLDFSVFMELKIYCNSRISIKNSVPELKSLLLDYESYFKNYWKNCKVAVTKSKIDLCTSMNLKLQRRAKRVNTEKAQLQKDLLIMKTAGEHAKKLYERKTQKQEKEEEKSIRDTLKIKKETVKLMRDTIKDDRLTFQRSFAQISRMHHQNNPNLKEAITSMKKIVKFLIKKNAELLDISHSLSRKIDNTNNQCTIKRSKLGCDNADKKMIKTFKIANTKFNTYSNNRKEASKLEIKLHKIAIDTVRSRMQEAQKTISSYILSLQTQNDHLKKRVEMSSTDMETIKSNGNKQNIVIYSKLVAKMKELEKKSGLYLSSFKSENESITNYIAECTEGSLNFSSECGKKGNLIISNVRNNMNRIVGYAKDYNRLNLDLANFSKKVSGTKD